MKCRTAKASFVTVWLFSSSLTMARQASDDNTSVGRKCLRANVLLPDPLGPIRTTRDRLGIEIFINDYSQLAVLPRGVGCPLQHRVGIPQSTNLARCHGS